MMRTADTIAHEIPEIPARGGWKRNVIIGTLVVGVIATVLWTAFLLALMGRLLSAIL